MPCDLSIVETDPPLISPAPAYSVDGWNSGENGSGLHYDANTLYTFDQPITELYARWEKSITFRKNYTDNDVHSKKTVIIMEF